MCGCSEFVPQLDASSRFTRWKSRTRPLWTRPAAVTEGVAVGLLDGGAGGGSDVGEERRNWTWPATSRRLRSFQAGSMLWKTAVSVSGPCQPTPKPSPFVVSTPRREWRALVDEGVLRFVEQLLEEDRARVG